MTNDKKAFKAGIWYTICNYLVKGLTFISMPIFTRILSTRDIGLFSNITSWIHILTIITTFDIYTSVTIARFEFKEELDQYISSTLFLGTMLTAIFYAIVLLFHSFFENLFLVDFLTLNLMFIYLLVYPAVQMYQIKNRIHYKYIATIIITFLNAFLSIGVSIILVLLMKNKLYGRIFGHFIPLIVMSTVIYIFIMKTGKSISRKYWKYALHVSIPMIGHSLASYILSSSDKIMITRMISADANALYSVSYTVSMIVSILWTSMNNAWSPWAYEQMDKKDYGSLKKNSKPYFIFFYIVSIIFILIAPELLYIMGGKTYVQAVYVLPPIMVGYVFQFVYSFYVNIEYYHKKQKYIAMGTAIAAIINIVLNYIFIPIFGYIAAAYTTLVGYMALYTVHYIIVKKMGYSDWYDNRFFIKYLIAIFVCQIIMDVLYHFIIIKDIVLGIITIYFIIMIIKNKNEIKRCIKKKSLFELSNILYSKVLKIHK